MFKKIASISFSGLLIASTITAVLSIIDNHTKRKDMATKNSIQLFRFKKLYEVLIKWNDNIANIDSQGFVKSFISDRTNHEIIAPLLDEKYRKKLDDQYEKTSYLMLKMCFLRADPEYENSDSMKKDDKLLANQFVDYFFEYDDMLLKAIKKQMCELMNQ